METSKREFIKLTVLMEDRESSGFLTEHGLSLYIEDIDKNILFDTGQSGKFILNAKKMNIDLNKLDLIVLSHGHYDHTGGLEAILKIKNGIPIIAHPQVIDDKYSFKNGKITFIGMPVKKKWNFEFTKKFKQISKNIYFLGEIEKNYQLPETHFFKDKVGKRHDEFNDDSALIIKNNDKISIICGCCHSGLINTIEAAKKHFNDKIHNIVGGFHLKDPESKLVKDSVEYLRRIDPDFIGISHCTSEEVGELLKREFKGKTHIVKTGDIIYF